MAKKYVSLSKLSIFLDNLKNTFSSIAHSHKVEDITDLTIDSTLSPTSTNPVQNKVLDAEFEAISEAMGALEGAVDGKSPVGHGHDVVTQHVDGFMSVEDKIKLDGLNQAGTTIITVPTSGWSSTVPYTIEIEVDGILANDSPLFYLVSTGDVATEAELAAVNTISDVTVNEGSVTITVTEIPTISFMIAIYVFSNYVESSLADSGELLSKINKLEVIVDGKADEGHNHDSDYDELGTASATVDSHNASTSSHSDIRSSVSEASARIDALESVVDSSMVCSFGVDDSGIYYINTATNTSYAIGADTDGIFVEVKGE